MGRCTSAKTRWTCQVPPRRRRTRSWQFAHGKVSVFAEKLWAVMGLEWLDDTLFVVHAPYLSAFRDTDGDGKADERIDLITGLGPKLPGFNGINDHIASGLRLGMDGFLYIAVGDKGIPDGVGEGWNDDPASGWRSDPDPARWLEPRGRLDRRTEPALGRTDRNRRDLHVRQRRRQQVLAE